MLDSGSSYPELYLDDRELLDPMNTVPTLTSVPIVGSSGPQENKALYTYWMHIETQSGEPITGWFRQKVILIPMTTLDGLEVRIHPEYLRLSGDTFWKCVYSATAPIPGAPRWAYGSHKTAVMKQIPAGISVLHDEYPVEEDDTHIGDGRDSDEYPVEEDDTHIRDGSDTDEYPVEEDDNIRDGSDSDERSSRGLVTIGPSPPPGWVY